MRYRIDRLKTRRTTAIETFLTEKCSFFRSEDEVRPWIRAGCIKIDDTHLASENEQIPAGSSVELFTPESYEPPVKKDYTIIYEDDHLLAVDKPAPLPVHPAGKYWFNTLTTLLIDDSVLEKDRIFPAHRLDRETSGVVLFAKDRKTASSLQEEFSKRQVRKEYVAVCNGIPESKERNITKPLKKSSTKYVRDVTLPSNTGQKAETAYEVLDTNIKTGISLLRIHPKTGRRHQIRAHLAYLHTPIIGDKLYGPYKDAFDRFMRDQKTHEKEIAEKLTTKSHLLHCHTISFIHPFKRSLMTITAPITEQLSSYCRRHSLKVETITTKKINRRKAPP